MTLRILTLRIGASLLLFSMAPNVFAQRAHIPGKYIVVLETGANPIAVANRHGVAADHVYSAALNGFAGAVPAGRLRALVRDREVAWVEQDQVVTAFAQVLPPGVQRANADLNATAKID